MTESSRKGIRLPWVPDEEGNEKRGTDNGATAATSDTALTSSLGAVMPAAEPAANTGPVVEAPAPFLQDLVDAMREITEQARDEAMTQLRAAAADRSAELRSATESRAAELRDLADSELVRIAEWEQGEMKRIGEEAAGKVSGRQAKLDAQLKANTASGEGAMSSVQARIDAFEREMADFFAQLNDLHDPVAFASAVKRMPRPPSLADTPAASAEHTAPARASEPTVEVAAPSAAEPAESAESAAPTVEGDATSTALATAEATAASTAADPSVEVATEASVEPAPTSGEANTAASDAPTPDAPTAESPDAEEVSTQVLVTGLTSFGAITSFKQSLERVAGVRRVSMGLGTSGEFIFTAVHGPGFDVAEAIRSFESAAQFVATGDQLRVTVGAKD
ncbi:MAG: hypothetical protein ABI578_00980 [Chloroflexota bacterium]